MPWSVPQFKNASFGSAGTSYTLALDGNTTSGNTLIVVARMGTSTVTVSGMSVTPGAGTFTRATSVSDGTQGRAIEIWSAPNITGGSTPSVTVTFSGSAPNGEITIYEGSGGDTAGALDGTNALVTNTSSPTGTTGPVTTTGSGDLVVKGLRCLPGPNGVIQSGWTELNPSSGSMCVGYLIQGAAGTVTGVVTPTGSAVSMGVIASFKAKIMATTLERASFANLKYGRANVTVTALTGITVGQVMTVTTPQGTMTGTVKKFIGSTGLKLGDLTFNRPSSFLLLPKGSAIA